MNLSENLSSSFNYTKKLFSEAGRLIILIVLDIIPIVNWIVVGYAARVLRESPGTEAPPRLEKYGEMFVDGAKVFFASLIYMIIPVILIVAGGASFFVGMFGLPSEAPSIMLGGTGLALMLSGIALAVLFLIMLGVGMAHMIKTRKFGKAFAFREIFNIIRRVGWARYLGWIVVVVVIAGLIGGIAGSIPLVGWIISAIISPALSVFIFRSLGILYNEGAPAELRVQPTTATPSGMACVPCGTPLEPYHKFCPKCGAPAPAPAALPSVTETTTKFCISCGASIPAAARFCGSCGAKQT